MGRAPGKFPADPANRNGGIYAIRNRVTGSVYVGAASTSFEMRWAHHVGSLRAGRHHCKRLQAAWIEHGEDAFEFIVLERDPGPGFTLSGEIEQMWIDIHLRRRIQVYNSRLDILGARGSRARVRVGT